MAPPRVRPRSSTHQLDVPALYERLDDVRRDNGMSWRDVARDTGLSPSALTRLSQGHTPEADAVVSLLRWLETDSLHGLVRPRPLATPPAPCVFCRIVERSERATIVREWPHALAIVPLGPVTEGHVLVIPNEHVADHTVSAIVAARTSGAVSELGRRMGPHNVITSVGGEATQTVGHLHYHLVPRRAGDGLHLPWTGQHEEREQQ